MYKFLLIVLMACYAMDASAQTFQYSRGWTNGKRSNSGVTNGDSPPIRQMMQNPMAQAVTATDLNSRER